MRDRARVSELFQDAIELSPDQRAIFLAEQCSDDSAALAEINLLIAADEKAEAAQFMDSPAIAIKASQFAADESGSRIGQLFGFYRILDLIAEGGMGEVYLAEDTKLNRKVAIKLTKSHLNTKEVLRRFDNEQQILANLQHANIARLYEAGTTDDGLPFFVMPYAEGKPLDQYANEKKLSIVERLKLFRTVCAAVTFAHQNLVVHRDLKPSNILVTNNGEPMLLDFGIAKLVQSDSDRQDATPTLFQVMTPEYASPEQVKGEPVTTATDVYSLGVILYELLTGQRPYKLKRRTADEITKAICEQELPKPSSLIRNQRSEVNKSEAPLVAGGDPGASLTVNRRAATMPLVINPKSLRGDLDNIMLKALRKEPARRYSSVEQFSEDIRHHLEGLPVGARKDTFAYRTSKFVKRNKIGVAAAALIVLTLAGGIIATTIQARRASRRFNEVRELAHSVLFDYHDEIAALPGSTKVREHLVRDALRYLDNLSKDTGSDVSLLLELAGAYEKVAAVQGGVDMSSRGMLLSTSNLGNMPGALESLHKAVTIREKVFAIEPNSNDAREELSYCYVTIGFVYLLNGPPDKAVEYLRKGMPVIEAQSIREPANEDLQYKLWNIYLGMAKALGNPGVPNLGDSSGAMEYMDKAREVGERLVSKDPTNREYVRMQGASYNAFGQMFAGAGKQQDALQSYQKAAAIDQVLVNADASNMFYKRELAVQLGNVGNSKLALSDRKGAVESLRQALAIYESMVAVDPNDAAIRRNAAVGYRNLAVAIGTDDRSGALTKFNKALDILSSLTTKDPSNADFSRQWAYTYLELSRFQSKSNDAMSSIESAQQGVKIDEELVASSPTNAGARNTLALLYRQLGDAYAALGAKGSKQQWSAAKESYQKALDSYQEMKSKGTLNGADLNRPDELAKEIAKCDEVLNPR